MRARYTAYFTKNMDFIQSTMRGPALEKFNLKETRDWAYSIHWLGLDVISSNRQGDIGFVTFEAVYEEDNKVQTLLEKSEFKKENGTWYYINGTPTNPTDAHEDDDFDDEDDD